jgi:hypothetical protein
LENRYSDLIQKYQYELENMKRGLERVRLDKENSYSSVRNYSHPNVVHYTKVSPRNSPITKR